MKTNRKHVTTDVKVVSSNTLSTLSLVKFDGVVAGFIEKYHDTRTEKNPYKVFEAVCGQGPVHVNMQAGMKPFETADKAIAYLRTKV